MLNQIAHVHVLTDSGFEHKQAEAIVRVIDSAQENLITKEYFETRIASLESRMEARFEKSLGDAKTSIVMWMAGIMIAQGAAIVTMLKVLGGQ